MLTRFARITSRLSIALMFLFGIAACGGGGSSDGGGFLPGDGGTFTLDLTLIDGNGNPTNSVTSTTPATLQVEVNSKNTSNESVLVSAATTIGELLPETGTALTNSDGIAKLRIEAGDELGAGTITVSVEGGDGVAIEEKISFQIGVADLRLGYFEDGVFVPGELGIIPSSLSPGGTALITVAVVDGNDQRVSTVELITLSSECLINGQAGAAPVNPAATVNGQANIIYTAAGCRGDDVLTATLDGGIASATGTVTVAGASANSIAFDAAEPEQIALKGTGGGTERQERSQVSFQVIDSNAVPIPGVVVRFALSTEIGGLSLENPTGVSNAEGMANAFVTSGNVATSVRVIASIETDDGDGNIVTVSTLSDVLVVSTGLPDQDSMSISVSGGGFIVENGFTMDGIERSITVRMGDKFNNSVPNGTSAIFTTEYGKIDPSCVTGVEDGERLGSTPIQGECTVLWTTQDPRGPTFGQEFVRTIYDDDYNCPSHTGSSGPCPDDFGGITGGRSTILVTAIGEESFLDQNGNGLYDENEPFENLPEAFLDNNEDRVYTPVVGPNCPPPTSIENCEAGGFEETFVDFNFNGEYDLNVDMNTGEGIFNGTLCPPAGEQAGWCSTELVNVRDSLVLTLSADQDFDVLLVLERSVVDATIEGRTYIAYISDVFNNPPAAGSTISVEPGGACEIISETTFTVPTLFNSGAYAIDIRTDGDGGSGTVNITVNPKDGPSQTETFGCRSFAPVDRCSLSPKPADCPP